LYGVLPLLIRKLQMRPSSTISPTENFSRNSFTRPNRFVVCVYTISSGVERVRNKREKVRGCEQFVIRSETRET
jgi:hypothetical protein